MRKLNPMRFHAPSSQYYVFLDGRRKYLGEDKENAIVLYQTLLRDLEGGDFRSRDSDRLLTVDTLISAYLRHLSKKTVDPRQWGRITPALDTLSKHEGSRPADRLRARMFKSVRERFVGLRTTKGEPVSRKWVNHLADEIRGLVRWAAEEELIPAESAASALLVRHLKEGEGGRETVPREPPPDGAVEATLGYLRSPVREMVLLQGLTGLRPAELCGMTVGRISRSPTQKVAMPRSGKTVAATTHAGVLCWVFVPARHKTLHRGKVRLTPIGPKGQSLLSPLMEGRGENDHVFDPGTVPRPEGSRGSSPRRTSYSTDTYYTEIRRAVQKCNRDRSRSDPPLPPIPFWFPYQLRHLAATEIGDEYDADTAAAVLGHSGLGTIDTYMQQQLGKALKVAAERG